MIDGQIERIVPISSYQNSRSLEWGYRLALVDETTDFGKMKLTTYGKYGKLL